MCDVFDELRERLPAAVAEALRDRLDRQPDGDFALHLRRRRGQVLDAWLDPPERIRLKSLDTLEPPGAK